MAMAHKKKKKITNDGPDSRRSSQDDKGKMDISYGGAGFMGVYYFGVNDCWNKYVPKDRVARFIGSSAGSLSAAYMAIGLPLKECLREILQFGEEVRSRPLGVFDPKHKVVDILPKRLDAMFPPDAHERASGKLHVVMTRLKDMKKVVVNEFETRQDLIDALNCSCYIPVWSGNHAPTFKGDKYIDGGFKDNQPVFDEHTIRVSCFSGATEISPYDSKRADFLTAKIRKMPVNLNWGNMKRLHTALFPPPSHVLFALIDRGYHDTKQFILDNDLIQCDKCYRSMCREQQPLYSKITPTISPAITPRSLSPAHSSDELTSTDRKNQLPLTLSTDGHLSASNIVGYTSDRRPKMTKQDRDFGSLLKDRLDRYSPESALGNSVESIDKSAHDTASPCIVVSGEEGLSTGQRVGGTSDSGASDGPADDQATGADIDKHARVMRDTSELFGKKKKKKRLTILKKRTSLTEITPPMKSDYLTKRRQTVAILAEARGDTSDFESESSSVHTDKFKPPSSPLPSCPPSPSLQRRCAECSRLRQQARADGVGEVLKEEIEKYRKASEAPASDSRLERGSSPWRWIRQIGLLRSYSFDGPAEAARATVAL